MKPIALLLGLALLPAALARLPGAGQEAAPQRSAFVIAPVAYFTPETRVAWGVVGIHYFRFGAALPEQRLSHYRFNLIRTQNRQTVAELNFEVNLPGGGWQFDGALKYAYWPNRFYGLGNRSAASDLEEFTSGNLSVRIDGQRRCGRSFLAGLRLETQSVAMFERRPGGVLAAGGLPGSDGGKLGGIGVLAKWDSRDNSFSSSRGLYAALVLSRYGRFLGGDFSFGQLAVDLRGFRPLGRGAVLAAQGVLKSAWGDCPFLALPRFGGPDLLRGYYDGRYRDRCLLALQGECRLPLAGRFVACAFAGVAQVQPALRQLQLKGFHLAGGAGLRYVFNRRENLILRLDAGFAGPKPAFYVTFAEAF